MGRESLPDPFGKAWNRIADQPEVMQSRVIGNSQVGRYDDFDEHGIARIAKGLADQARALVEQGF